ncbi:MAG: tRNA 2-thiouridine(34) synthase MnmA, partial [Francisellaceae bacterium]|nr:tRNA 2-thiouridine(34) synthase MnmA [Francisellaceae bacterium]
SALFPLANIEKSEIRSIAKDLGLLNHDKKDSTGICFISPGKFRDFLQSYIPCKPGKILTPDGIEIGIHNGVMYYTIGQRHGLGIGGQKNFGDEPWFIVEKDAKTNILTVVQGTAHELLYHNALEANNFHWINPDHKKNGEFSCQAKIRYRQTDQQCQVVINEESCRAYFDEPQRAVSPGQSIVFYQNDICLGGAIITKALNSRESNNNEQ